MPPAETTPGIAAQSGCEPLEVWQDRSAGASDTWVSSVVTLQKRGRRFSPGPAPAAPA